MRHDPTPLLVDADWLEQHLQAPDLRVLDCTTYMTPQPVGPSRIRSGRPDWERAHIPGSTHVCMVDDLSDPEGRFPYTLPGEGQIERLLSGLGIGNEHHVVLYGAAHPMVITRAWWVLSALGHERVSILDGGWEGWEREGRPTTSAPTSRPPAVFKARRRTELIASAGDVAQSAASGSCLINALSPEQFSGRGGAHYGRPGRIPGSISVPARDLVDPQTMTWLPLEEIERRFVQAGLPEADTPVITYCGGGIAASLTLFALHRLGRTRTALYDNSLLEWSADPERPMISD